MSTAPVRRHRVAPLTAQRGASLVELMVAMVIGLFVALVALSTAQTFGSVTRSQGGQGDAVIAAAAGLEAMKYDAQMSGLGFHSDGLPLCQTLNVAFNNTVLAQSRTFQAARINRKANGTDELEVIYGTSILAGAGTRTLSQMGSVMGPVAIGSGAALTAGAAVLISNAAQSTPCTVATVGAVTPGTGGQSTIAFATAGQYTPADWSVMPQVPAYVTGSAVSPLGELVWHRYYVRNDALYMLDVLTNTEAMIAEGIVMIRAQYGLASTTTDSAVSSWRSATEDAPLSSTDRQRLRMIRLGVLAVNTQRERPATTGSCDTTLIAPTLWPGETVDLSARTDWQCYRYRSFSTVVSLRNMLLGQSL